MSILQNNPKDVDLSTISTLDSIFEMEQFVVILDENSIPWKVVEHDDILLKSYSGNIGHSTLLVETGKEKESFIILNKLAQQAKLFELFRSKNIEMLDAFNQYAKQTIID